MKFDIVVLPRADRDVQGIFDWLAERTVDGALKWYEAYSDAINSLRTNPERCYVAAESPVKGREIRQPLFHTRKGNVYRLLFTIAGSEVHILHVRGQGQRPIEADEF